jgi:hypothetical protein
MCLCVCVCVCVRVCVRVCVCVPLVDGMYSHQTPAAAAAAAASCATIGPWWISRAMYSSSVGGRISLMSDAWLRCDAQTMKFRSKMARQYSVAAVPLCHCLSQQVQPRARTRTHSSPNVR